MTSKWLAGSGILSMAAVIAAGALIDGPAGPELFGIRAEFILFALTLLGVALFHYRTLEVAVTGLTAILVLKFLTVADFQLGHHLLEEGPVPINLLGLLLGFAAAGVWLGIVISALFTKTDWKVVPTSIRPPFCESMMTFMTRALVAAKDHFFLLGPRGTGKTAWSTHQYRGRKWRWIFRIETLEFAFSKA